MSYWLLFISAFGAATLLPLQSEAVLITLLIQGLSNPLYQRNNRPIKTG